ncbi:hypothetical protein FRX31_011942 [Thalictrum thalictroides]|uniref:Uncharacterized protein n=1 Tax=Thalictrum thalictroides TaxID=46969 RepID=A0A7J6WM89_THATH|nr:hypothetical protein FRX31_011942 [Thalictrum thalictroides]
MYVQLKKEKKVMSPAKKKVNKDPQAWIASSSDEEVAEILPETHVIGEKEVEIFPESHASPEEVTMTPLPIQDESSQLLQHGFQSSGYAAGDEIDGDIDAYEDVRLGFDVGHPFGPCVTQVEEFVGQPNEEEEGFDEDELDENFVPPMIDEQSG